MDTFKKKIILIIPKIIAVIGIIIIFYYIIKQKDNFGVGGQPLTQAEWDQLSIEQQQRSLRSMEAYNSQQAQQDPPEAPSITRTITNFGDDVFTLPGGRTWSRPNEWF